MKVRSSLMVIVALFALAGAAQVLANEKETNKLQGTWRPVAAKNGDETVEADDLEKVSLTIDGNKFKLQDRDFSLEGTFRLDPAASPKAFDATIPDADGDIHVVGIYKLERDTLTLHFAAYETMQAVRPTDFDSVTDAASLIVWKRVQQ